MPRDLDPSALEEEARAIYRQGKIADALDKINNAVKAADQPTASQLDLLIACQEKTGDTNGALKTAKQLLRQHEDNPMGYLRAAHVLQKLDRVQDAPKILERGLKAVPKEHALYAQLERKLSQLSHSLQARSDPLSKLPLEMVSQIFNYLTFKQRVSCIRVCKAWQSLMRSMPHIWLDMDFKLAQKQVGTAFVNKCFSNSLHRIEKAYVHRVSKQDEVIKALTKRCNYLGDLTVVYSTPIPPLVLDCFPMATNLRNLKLESELIALEAVVKLLPRCKQLESFDCSGIKKMSREREIWEPMPPSLERLRIQGKLREAPQYISLANLNEHLYDLKELSIIGFQVPEDLNDVGLELKDCTRLLSLELEHSKIRLFSLPETLTALKVDTTNNNIWGTTRPSMVMGVIPETGLPLLEHLSCRELTDASTYLSFSATSPANLISLTIAENWKPPPESYAVFSLPRLQFLKDLSIHNASDVDDKIIAQVIQNQKELESVHFFLSDVTGYGIKQLVLNLPRLRLIKLTHCAKVSPDGIEWARGRGLVVDVKVSEHRSGLKVRWGR